LTVAGICLPNAAPVATLSAPIPSFWQRRVRAPLLALLTQGATPEKLASGIAWSAVCSLFPFFGCTTGLNAAVAFWRGLNQPLMQAINYALSPLHLVMILAYVRLGEWLWVADDEHFSVRGMLSSFHELSLGAFLHKFAWAGVHALTAWTVTAPLLFAGVYQAARPALRRLARFLPAEPSSFGPATVNVKPPAP
jgi:uncharacterized protein (DUF2062 family)